VLNKIDALGADARVQRRENLVTALSWEGPVFEISAVSGEGCKLLCGQIMDFLEEQNERERAS
jgi:GTP-binding protein